MRGTLMISMGLGLGLGFRHALPPAASVTSIPWAGFDFHQITRVQSAYAKRQDNKENAMSYPAAGPITEADSLKQINPSKTVGKFNVPSIDINSLMDIQRRNIEAVRFVNQVAFDSLQSFAGRQAELMRKGLEEATSLVHDIMSLPTHEEKVMRHAEASKIVIEKCIANAYDASETLAKCNNQVMKMASNRMNEGLQELQGLIKPDLAA
jgi:phasin family protein